MTKPGYVSIMASRRNGTIYIGATSDLPARARELQMKKWKRLWKLREIETMNPDWDDLFKSLF